jgi:ribosome-binding factor A
MLPAHRPQVQREPLAKCNSPAYHDLVSFVVAIMTSRRISRKDLLSGCQQAGPEDGVDPRYDHLDGGRRRPGRKTLQLCSQVAETLAGVLAEQANGVLRDLLVVSVTPAGGGRLLATLTPAPSAAVRDRAVILEHLGHAHGLLRNEVARAVNRRKAPDLVFQVQ